MSRRDSGQTMRWILGKCGLALGLALPVLFPLPYFFVCAPRTLLRTMRALFGKTLAWSRDEFVSFNALDLAPRCWYRKIARDQSRQTWLGYVWDDGLGTPIRCRFYNNWLTYFPLDRLGAPVCLGLGYLLTAASFLIVFGLEGSLAKGMLAALVVLGSPLFIASQVFYGKPETCWWFPAPLLVYFILHKSWFAAGLTWSLISFVNFPASVVLGCISALGFLLFDREVGSLVSLTMASVPGALLAGGRLLVAWRDGFTQRAVRSQREATQAKGSHLPPVVLLSAMYLLLPLLLLLRGQNWSHVIFTGAPLILYWVIFFVYYFNDPAPIVALMFACEGAYAAFYQDATFIVAALLFAFVSPLAFPYTLVEFREDVPQGTRGLGGLLERFLNPSWLRATWRKYLDFPRIASVHLTETRPLLELFESLPEYSRVILESDPRGRKAFGYRGLVNFLDCFLPSRRIEVIPDEYLLQFWGDLARELHGLFGAEGYSARSLGVAKCLGAGYVLIFSERLLERVKADGGEVVAVRECCNGSEDWCAVTDHPRLHLVRLPFNTCVVDPQPKTLRIQGNRLMWEALERTTYRIRYAYHPNFCARSLATGEPVGIRPSSPPNVPGIEFIEVESPADGEIELSFRRSVF